MLKEFSNNTTSEKVKIFALPFAGGNVYAYKSFLEFIPDGYEWHSIELPGRTSRIGENLLHSIPEMVEDVFDQISNQITTGEYMIYGHSMGTLIGYELTKKIAASHLKNPKLLFVTGRGGPSINKSTTTECKKPRYN